MAEGGGKASDAAGRQGKLCQRSHLAAENSPLFLAVFPGSPFFRHADGDINSTAWMMAYSRLHPGKFPISPSECGPYPPGNWQTGEQVTGNGRQPPVAHKCKLFGLVTCNYAIYWRRR